MVVVLFCDTTRSPDERPAMVEVGHRDTTGFAAYAWVERDGALALGDFPTSDGSSRSRWTTSLIEFALGRAR